MPRLSLDGPWRLTFTEDDPEFLVAEDFEAPGGLLAHVPEPVHHSLLREGLIEDPNVGLGALSARWVEEQFWVYRRLFEAPEVPHGAPVWLHLDLIEFHARVFVNGQFVGEHANAHVPARFEISDALRPGENVLAVLVQDGARWAIDKPVRGWLPDRISEATRRHWTRRPQYQGGWDWNPHLSNLGLLGSIELVWGLRVTEETLVTRLDPGAMRGSLRVGLDADFVGDASLEVVVPELGVALERPLEQGRNHVELEVESPELWWPVGTGVPKLYEVEVRVRTPDESWRKTFLTGFRSVEIEQRPHPEGGALFVVVVNGRRVFCKGSNWVPPDLFYSAVPASRVEALVDLALELGFNLLRIWGGASYASDELLRACERRGIMVWQDCAFACAKYPWQDAEFAEAVRAEIHHNVRRMNPSPALVVWCGNNEIECGDSEWRPYCQTEPIRPHRGLFEDAIPAMLAEERVSIPYWPSSPFSPDGSTPSNPLIGDQHPWRVSLGDEGAADWWHYRGQNDRFPNEGGVLGASTVPTLRQFLPEDQRRMHSPSWRFHDNRFAFYGAKPGEPSRASQTFRLWTGLDGDLLEWELYAHLSGLLQAEALHEYIRNYRWRMFDSAAAIFWMFADSWPTTHGFTTQDYYLRRKHCFHPVRRAFRPVVLALAEEGSQVGVYGVVDGDEPVSLECEFGVFSLAGAVDSQTRRLELAPNASTKIGQIERAKLESVGLTRAGAFVRATDSDGRTLQDRVFFARFGELELQEAEVSVSPVEGGVELSCERFVWSVLLDLEGKAETADNCFDLLPGRPYFVPDPAARVLATGASLMARARDARPER